MKVLYLKHTYSIIDGSSAALYETIKDNDKLTGYKVLARKIRDRQDDIDIKVVSSKRELEKELIEGDYDAIHYFKTYTYDLFNWAAEIVEKRKLNIPIITTVCQRPSYRGMWLSPNEINKSDVIAFIDKAAYNDPLFSFIPEEKKVLNYFGRDQYNLDQTDRLKDQKREKDSWTVIGRGSTLNKCPQDIIEVFDRLEVPNKKLVIAGIEPGSWLEAKAAGRKDIEILPPVPYEKWLERCATFDIFWYYLPETCHSSIDGTLGDAMLLEKPAVYMGPPAPAERFVQGENGYVATTHDEMLGYLKQLCDDPELRERIGKRARLTTARDFSLYRTINVYNELIEKLKASTAGVPENVVPMAYNIKFYKSCWKPVLRSWGSGSFLERLWQKIKCE